MPLRQSQQCQRASSSQELNTCFFDVCVFARQTSQGKRTYSRNLSLHPTHIIPLERAFYFNRRLRNDEEHV